MSEIKELCSHSFHDVCEVIRSAHLAEYQTNGLIINTSNITAEQLQQEMEAFHGKCLGYFMDGILVGTLSVLCYERQYWFSRDQGIRTIKYVAVRPEYQGRGLASQLLKFVKDHDTVENTPLLVSTDQRNRHAIKLYEKNGFQIVNVMRSRKAKSNSVRMAWWPAECPVSKVSVKFHIMKDQLKCAIKKLLDMLLQAA